MLRANCAPDLATRMMSIVPMIMRTSAAMMLDTTASKTIHRVFHSAASIQFSNLLCTAELIPGAMAMQGELRHQAGQGRIRD